MKYILFDNIAQVYNEKWSKVRIKRGLTLSQIKFRFLNN